MAITSTGMVYAGSPVLTMVFLALAAAFSFSLLGVGPSIIQDTAPAPMRGQVAALYTGTLNIIGAGFGPVAVGLLTDYVLRDQSKVGLAIVITCVTAGTIGMLIFRSGFATYAATRAAATDWRETAPTLAAPAIASVATAR
jgi:MFS family permease